MGSDGQTRRCMGELRVPDVEADHEMRGYRIRMANEDVSLRANTVSSREAKMGGIRQTSDVGPN